MQFKNVPYRHWRGPKTSPHICEPATNSAYQKVMNLIGKAIKEGKAVTIENVVVNKVARTDLPYDVINVTIED